MIASKALHSDQTCLRKWQTMMGDDFRGRCITSYKGQVQSYVVAVIKLMLGTERRGILPTPYHASQLALE